MSFITFLALLVALGICFVPVWLLRQPAYRRAQDYFVSSQSTRPEVVRNSAIAYALRMAAFGPLFAWGASGDFWPAILGAAFFALGIYLVYILRRPLLEFLDTALAGDQSITVHEFISRQHGNDVRVRLLAASLTVCALVALLVGEALGVVAFVKAMLPGSPATAYSLVFGTLLLMILHTVLSGHSGVMHSAQLQLGMLYLGLFGSTVLLLYLHVSALTPTPSHGTLAIVLVAVCSAIILLYRRSRYVDTSPIRSGASDRHHRRERSGERLLSRFGKILNVCLSVLLVVVIVLAFMQLYAAGLPAIARDSASALGRGTQLSGVGLIALCLLPLLHPLVDVTNWQKLAAIRRDASSGAEARESSTALRAVFRTYAAESALIWLFMCMLGAIAAIALEMGGGAVDLQTFVARLVADDSALSAVVLLLLLVCVFAVALSTMSALLSASLCTIRYDVLAALWPDMTPQQGPATKEAVATRHTLVAGGGICLGLAAAYCVAAALLEMSFTSSTFLALLFAFCCAQLSFVPLVVGPIVARTRRPAWVSPRWALLILGAGAASGIAAIIAYVATGTEGWLWAAVPVCLGAGFVLFAIARATSRHRA